MTFSVFDVLLLIGITQGVVAVPLLLFSREKHLSNVFLALAILTFCLMFLKILLNYNGVASQMPYRYLPNAFEMATAPLFYFYLSALIEKGFRWRSRYLIHFIPLLAAQFYAFLIYFSVFDAADPQTQDNIVNQLHYRTIKIHANDQFYLSL